MQPARYAAGGYGYGASTNRCFKVDAALSVAAQPVYDLTNAGPRSRFVVRGNEGPFIVHNCENAVQAVAGSLLRHVIWRLDREWPQLVVGHVHDEVVALTELQDVAAGREALRHAMLDLPAWAEGLPIACEASESFYYTKTVD